MIYTFHCNAALLSENHHDHHWYCLHLLSIDWGQVDLSISFTIFPPGGNMTGGNRLVGYDNDDDDDDDDDNDDNDDIMMI